MKVGLGTLVSSMDSLRRLSAEPLPARTAFDVAKVLRAVEAELKEYAKVRQQIFEQNGCRLTEDKSQYIIPEEAQDIVQHELNELHAAEVDIPHEPIQVEALEKARLSASDMLVLAWLLSEG